MDNAEVPVKPDDGFLALVILAVALVVTALVAIRFLKSSKSSQSATSQQSAFTPPPEREAFLKAVEQLNPSEPSQSDELKKLLMKRAIKTIPILLNLQNESGSIDRLYKKGMLTDDMHFKMKELKAFVDEEFNSIKEAADDLSEGWGEQIWPQAMQFYQVLQKQVNASKDKELQAEASAADVSPAAENTTEAAENDTTEVTEAKKTDAKKSNKKNKKK